MTLVDSRMTVNRYRQELVTLEAEEGRAWAELEMLLGTPLFDPATARATTARETTARDTTARETTAGETAPHAANAPHPASAPAAGAGPASSPHAAGVSVPATPIRSLPATSAPRRAIPVRPGGAP